MRITKDGEQEEGGFDLGYKIPETAGILKELDKAIENKNNLMTDHQKQNEEEDKKAKGKKYKQKPAGGEVCICENPYCRIGPMMSRE